MHRMRISYAVVTVPGKPVERKRTSAVEWWFQSRLH